VEIAVTVPSGFEVDMLSYLLYWIGIYLKHLILKYAELGKFEGKLFMGFGWAEGERNNLMN
jgi:hypothetical protein